MILFYLHRCIVAGLGPIRHNAIDGVSPLAGRRQNLAARPDEASERPIGFDPLHRPQSQSVFPLFILARRSKIFARGIVVCAAFVSALQDFSSIVIASGCEAIQTSNKGKLIQSERKAIDLIANISGILFAVGWIASLRSQ